MRRLGEPQRKVCKLEKQLSDEETPAKADRAGKQPRVSDSEKKGLTDGPRRETGAQKRRRKVENRAKARKEREATKARKKKEREVNLRKRGERLIKNQPKIAVWFRKEGPGSKRAPTGGKTGV